MSKVRLHRKTLITTVKSFYIYLFHRYAETVGLEGPFQSNSIGRTSDSSQYQIIMRGNLYKEVENAEVALTTKAMDRPRDFEFKVYFY